MCEHLIESSVSIMLSEARGSITHMSHHAQKNKKDKKETKEKKDKKAD